MRSSLLLSLVLATSALVQAPRALAQAPRIDKIDPPNWFPQFPAPMLLLKGENLAGAKFSLSDPALKIQKTEFSANGHYAQLWIAASPAAPETIQIKAHTAAGEVSAPFIFAPRHNPRDGTAGFAGFSDKDVMYLIMPDRFADGDPTNDGPDHAAALKDPHAFHGGDIKGITQHLDYLQTLGITTVWITPIDDQAGEPTSYHGYGTTDMYGVDQRFGNLQDYKDLATALHARHMKLVMDTVPNHIGPAHPWVDDTPDPTWFHGTKAHHTLAQGDFDPLTNPHAPWRDQKNVTQGWFADILPDLNQEDPAVSKYLIQNTIWWIEEAGIDGLRIDTFPYVGRPFWRDFHAALHTLYPNLTTVGEIYNGDPTITSAFAGGATRNAPGFDVDTGLSTPFDFPSHFALRNAFLKDAPFSKFADILRQDNLYPHPERLVPFLGNHDTSRFLNDPAATPRKLDLAFTILFTMRGMPQIYSGDEIAMRGGDDPDNRRDFPGGFGPSSDPEQPSAFTAATRTPEQQRMFTAVQTLLTLRAQHPALQSGDMQILKADEDTIVYVRTLGSEHILVAVNKSHTPKDIVIPTEDTAIAGLEHPTPLLGDAVVAVSSSPHLFILQLPPESASILSLR